MPINNFHLREIKIFLSIFLCISVVICGYKLDFNALRLPSYIAKAFSTELQGDENSSKKERDSRDDKVTMQSERNFQSDIKTKIECKDDSLIGDFAYEFVDANIDFDVSEDDEYGYAQIKLKNTGAATWYGDSTRCKNKIYLGTQAFQDRKSIFWTNYQDSQWIIDKYRNRVILTEDEIETGATATFKFKFDIPDKDGIYREFFAPVLPNVGWINQNFYVDFMVGSVSDEDKEKIGIANLSSSTANFNGAKNIEVDLNTQTMYLKYGEEKFYELRVSSGNPSKHPTPKATWTIVNKSELRTSGGKVPYKMPFWLGLSRPKFGFQGYGLHALPYLVNAKGQKYWDEKNEPKMHLGTPVSHGCVRMAPGADEIVWNWAEIGTAVWTH